MKKTLTKFSVCAISICLSIILIVLSASSVFAISETVMEDAPKTVFEGFEYETENNSVTIIKYTGDKSELVIPETIEEKSVERINLTLENKEQITSVSIPSSVKTIEANSFKDCINLTSITLPDVALKISSTAFKNTGYANNALNWQNGILYIGNHAVCFDDVLLLNTTNITIPNGTLSVCDINNLPNLVAVELAESVLYFGGVHNCSKFSTLNFPVTSRATIAGFSGCEALSELSIPAMENIPSDFIKNCQNLSSVKFSDSTVSIGSYAFKNCDKLTSVIFPSSVKIINKGAFEDCDLLENIEFSREITKIGSSAFKNCKKLKLSPLPVSLTEIGTEAFLGCSSLSGNLVIPDSVVKINANAFKGCEFLTSVHLGKNLSDFSEAFINCNNLKEYTISKDNKNLVVIDSAVYDSAVKKLIDIPNNISLSVYEPPKTVTDLQNVFEGVRNIHTLIIPKTVERFILKDKTSVKTIKFEGSASLWNTLHKQNVASGINLEFDYRVTTNEPPVSSTIQTPDNSSSETPSSDTSLSDSSSESSSQVSSELTSSEITSSEVIYGSNILLELLFENDELSIKAVENAFPSGTSFKVENITDSKQAASIVKKLNNTCQKLSVYKVIATVNGVTVAPNKTVEIHFEVPEGFNPMKTKIFYVDENLSPHKLSTKVNLETYTISAEVPGMGHFVVGESEAEENYTIAAIIIIFLILAACAVSIYLLIYKKKRQTEN